MLFGLIATVMITFSGFASNQIKKAEDHSLKVETISSIFSNEKAETCLKQEVFAHDCTYRMSNSSGQYLGDWTLYDCPNDLPCGSQHLIDTAIRTFNERNQ